MLTRLRTGPEVAGRTDEEGRIDRRFSLPGPRQFALRAEVRIGDGEALHGGCREDLVEVDGVAVPVRPAADQGDGPGPVVVEGCEPVDLSAGTHRVVTATVGEGPAVDRVVLSSDPSGAPAAVAPRGTGGEAPPIEVTAMGSDHVSARVEGVDDPFWLVVAQSHSGGWSLEADGAEVGPHQLVDGYANGWRITPCADTVEVSLRWTPQRLVWIGLAIRGATAIVAAALVWRSRRRPEEDGDDLAHAPRLAWGAPAGPRAQDAGPVLVMVGTALVGVIVAPLPVAALGTAVAAVVAIAGPMRWMLAFVPAAALVAARVLERPSAAWVVVLLVVAEVLRELGSVSPRATR